MRPVLLSLLLIAPLAAVPPGRRRERPLVVATRAKAKKGQAKAQFDLGVMYAFGQGVPKDEKMAVTWYLKAAEQGYAKAQYNLGVCFDFGRGLPKDPAEAVAWYRKAAEQGHAKAQCNLGVNYKYGLGVEQDSVEAYAWLTLAEEGGESKAAASRDSVILDLTPERLEQAKTRARELRGRIPLRKRKG